MKALEFRAVVLAAGLGTRLRPLTQFLPKPLLPVTGTPVLGHTLSSLAKAGCRRAAINLFHQGDKIASRFGNRYEGIDLVYSPEDELLGTLGALAPLREFLSPVDIVVVVNGDSLCRWPIKRLLRQHRKAAARATLLVSTRAPIEAFGGGIGIDRSGAVVSLTPDKSFGQVEKRVVFAGAHAFAPKLVAHLEPRPADFVSDLYLPMLEAGERIEALESSRPWFDLGTPAGYLFGACDWAQRRGPAKVAGRSWIAADAEVDASASVRRAVIEAGARLGSDVQVERSVVLSEARISERCRVHDSIIGFRAELPPGTVVERRLVTKARADVIPRAGDSVVGGLVYSPLG